MRHRGGVQVLLGVEQEKAVMDRAVVETQLATGAGAVAVAVGTHPADTAVPES